MSGIDPREGVHASLRNVPFVFAKRSVFILRSFHFRRYVSMAPVVSFPFLSSFFFFGLFSFVFVVYPLPSRAVCGEPETWETETKSRMCAPMQLARFPRCACSGVYVCVPQFSVSDACEMCRDVFLAEPFSTGYALGCYF